MVNFLRVPAHTVATHPEPDREHSFIRVMLQPVSTQQSLDDLSKLVSCAEGQVPLKGALAASAVRFLPFSPHQSPSVWMSPTPATLPSWNATVIPEPTVQDAPSDVEDEGEEPETLEDERCSLNNLLDGCNQVLVLTVVGGRFFGRCKWTYPREKFSVLRSLMWSHWMETHQFCISCPNFANRRHHFPDNSVNSCGSQDDLAGALESL